MSIGRPVYIAMCAALLAALSLRAHAQVNPTPAEQPHPTAATSASAAPPTPAVAPVTPSPGPLQPPEPANPGRVDEISNDRATGVWSAWLGNGVLVHCLELKPRADVDQKKDPATVEVAHKKGPATVVITIALAGGELLESTDNRGVSDAAVLAWQRPAAASFDSRQMDQYLARAGVRLQAWAGADTLMLRITTPRDGIEPGLRVARLLFSEPRLDEDAVRKWADESIARLAPHRRPGESIVHAATVDAIFGPAEARTRPTSIDSLNRLTAPAAQAWLDRALGAAPGGDGLPHPLPMEVGIAGDIDPDRTLSLCATYLGSLPARPRISEQTFDELRVAPRAPGPITGDRAIGNWHGNAFIVAGFFGADLPNLADYRALAVASEVLTARLASQLPQAENVGGDARASSVAGVVYPGFGLFLATTEVEPDRATRALEHINEVLTHFAAGPSRSEVQAATEKLATDAARLLRDPRAWSGVLSTSRYHAYSPADFAGAEQAYRAITLDQVKQAITKFDIPERRIRLIVRPDSAPTEK